MFAKLTLGALFVATSWAGSAGSAASTPQDVPDVGPAAAACVNAGVWAVGGGGVTRFTARGPHAIGNNGPDAVVVQVTHGNGQVEVIWLAPGKSGVIPAAAGERVAIRSQGIAGAAGTR
jgi:hypothetical protein